MSDSGQAETQIVGTGVEGLDDVLGGGLQRRRLYLVEGVPGSGKTTLALQFLLAAASRGETVLYVTLSETMEELAQRRRLARLVARPGDRPRADADRGRARSRRAVHDVPSLGARARRDHAADSGGRRSDQPVLHRVRFAVGAAAAGRQRVALPPADPGAQAVLRGARVHRHPARRHDGVGPRLAGAEHRPCRHPAGAAQPRVRDGSAAAARREVPRRWRSGAATTTTRSAAAGCTCSRAWSRRSTGRCSRARSCRARFRRSTS